MRESQVILAEEAALLLAFSQLARVSSTTCAQTFAHSILKVGLGVAIRVPLCFLRAAGDLKGHVVGGLLGSVVEGGEFDGEPAAAQGMRDEPVGHAGVLGQYGTM